MTEALRRTHHTHKALHGNRVMPTAAAAGAAGALQSGRHTTLSTPHLLGATAQPTSQSCLSTVQALLPHPDNPLTAADWHPEVKHTGCIISKHRAPGWCVGAWPAVTPCRTSGLL